MSDENPHNEDPVNSPPPPKPSLWERGYNFIKKICPQIRHIDKAFHSKDPLEITSTLLNEGGKIIGGNIGNAMRFGHDVSNMIGSDNPYDAVADGITASLRYSDFRNQGNHFAQNISSGLHQAQNQAQIEEKIRTNVNKNIEIARRVYQERMLQEAKKKTQSETSPYDAKMAERIKQRSLQENDAFEATAPFEETLSGENSFSNPEPSNELSLPAEAESHFNNGEEKIMALRTKQATETKARTSSSSNKFSVSERLTYSR